MVELMVRLEGAPEVSLEKMIKLGYFKSKNEAIRVGIMEVAKNYNLLPAEQEIKEFYSSAGKQMMEIAANKPNDDPAAMMDLKETVRKEEGEQANINKLSISELKKKYPELRDNLKNVVTVAQLLKKHPELGELPLWKI